MQWELRVKREGTLFPFFAYLQGQRKIGDLFNIPFRYRNIKWVDGELYYSEKDNEEFMRIIKGLLINNPLHLKRIVTDNIMQEKKLNKIAHRYPSNNIFLF